MRASGDAGASLLVHREKRLAARLPESHSDLHVMNERFRGCWMPVGRGVLAAVLLAGCGDPRGSGVPFADTTPPLVALLDSLAGDSAVAGTSDSAAAGDSSGSTGERPAFEVGTWRGAYRRNIAILEFRPCRDDAVYEMRGRGDALMVLRDRHRWSATDPVRPLYAVFRGGFADDTVPPAESGGQETSVVRRFVLTGVDSLRTWRRGDCGMDQPPSMVRDTPP